MSEPENPRWLSDISHELRRDVPVRPAWRARLLDDVVRAPRPSRDDVLDDRFDDAVAAMPNARRRSIVLSPLAGVAAAALFAALGAGITYRAMSSRATRGDSAGASTGPSTTAPASARVASSVAPPVDREVVRFELSAPKATRVALVGSFNEWNPVATPLVRDQATGRWMVSLRLAPGRHVYAFVVDGDVTADPSAPRAADDDFGSVNSVVFVSAPQT